jgi:hypothetical protein
MGTLVIDEVEIITAPTMEPLYWRGDIDNSCGVDMSDLELLLDSWLAGPTPAWADLKADGKINIKDLALFAEEWMDGQEDSGQ